MIFVFLNSSCILLFRNMPNIQFRVYWKNLETNGQWLAVSLWFLTGIYFVEIDHLNRPRTLRVITFINDNYIHALTVSFREKNLSKRFFGTPGIVIRKWKTTLSKTGKNFVVKEANKQKAHYWKIYAYKRKCKQTSKLCIFIFI